MVVILIGAIIVGSIHTVWAGCVNSEHENNLITTDYRQEKITLEKGAELGHFQMGSTVICLFPNNSLSFSADLTTNQHKKYGELIGTINSETIRQDTAAKSAPSALHNP